MTRALSYPDFTQELLALALQGSPRRKDLLGEVLGSVRLR